MTMNEKKKQIEEMALTMCEDCATYTKGCKHHPCDAILDNAATLYNAGYRKQSENEALEAIDKFRSALMDKFIDLCRGNDFNKINLLLIGETIDRTFDDAVAKMKGGAE